MKLRNNYGTPLRAKIYLIVKGMSIKKAAENIGVSAAFLSNCLNGKQKPSPKVKRGLSKILRVSQKELLKPLEG